MQCPMKENLATAQNGRENPPRDIARSVQSRQSAIEDGKSAVVRFYVGVQWIATTPFGWRNPDKPEFQSRRDKRMSKPSRKRN